MNIPRLKEHLSWNHLKLGSILKVLSIRMFLLWYFSCEVLLSIYLFKFILV